MITTIEDAERAVRENPQDLRTLSMAADLLQDRGDPRGEDFAACLLGTITAEEVMRRHPADVTAMYYAAWRMERVDEMCESCDGEGWHRTRNPHTGWFGEVECATCDGTGRGNWDNTARAEALRLLAECGKVGEAKGDGVGGYWGLDVYQSYFGPPNEFLPSAVVPTDWADTARLGTVDVECDRVPARLALINTYAKADPDTRQRWAAETRALTAKEEVPA